MEAEREKHNSTSRETTSGTEATSTADAQGDDPEVEVQAIHDEVVVNVSCPFDSHPVSRIIQATKDSEINVVDSKLAAGTDTVFHTFVVKSQGSEPLTKEKCCSISA